MSAARRKPAPETFDAYVARIASYVEGREALAVLRATPARLAKAVAGVSRRRLDARAGGRWSAGEVLAHLSEIELLWGYRIRLILERDGVEIAGMDQEAWARNSGYDRMDPRESLNTFRALRRANLRLLEGLTPRQRRRHGKHSQFGRLTIDRISRLVAGHDVNHTRQIEERLGRKPRAAR